MKKVKNHEAVLVMLDRKATQEEKEKLFAEFEKHEFVYNNETQSLLIKAPRDFIKKLAKVHRCIQSY